MGAGNCGFPGLRFARGDIGTESSTMALDDSWRGRLPLSLKPGTSRV